MRLVATHELIRRGGFPESIDWERASLELRRAIAAVTWPPGEEVHFFLDPKYDGSSPALENGVKPIKEAFQRALVNDGWVLEQRPHVIDEGGKPGKLDAVKALPKGLIAVEWETGNISSTHRALNKMALGLLQGTLLAGVLILPSRDLYRYLTDRIGNIAEIEPYFPLYRSIQCIEGVLAIMVIEHDGFRVGVGRIPKGTDGRALR